GQNLSAAEFRKGAAGATTLGPASQPEAQRTFPRPMRAEQRRFAHGRCRLTPKLCVKGRFALAPGLLLVVPTWKKYFSRVPALASRSTARLKHYAIVPLQFDRWIEVESILDNATKLRARLDGNRQAALQIAFDGNPPMDGGHASYRAETVRERTSCGAS